MLLSSHSSSASSPSSQSDGNSRESRIRRLLEKIEQVTAQGNPNLPVMVSDLRAEYYRDFQFMLDTLARLGVELKSYPSTCPPPNLVDLSTNTILLQSIRGISTFVVLYRNAMHCSTTACSLKSQSRSYRTKIYSPSTTTTATYK